MYLPLRIFISATLEDLKAERESVLKVLSELNDQVIVESMEKWGSADPPPKEVSLKKLEECNVYLGIFGLKYGAITEDEYNHACQIPGMTRLIYVRGEETPIPPKFTENDPNKLERLNKLKARIKEERTFFQFGDANMLAHRVFADIDKILKGPAGTTASQEDITPFQKKWLKSRHLEYNPFNIVETKWETDLGSYYVQLGNLNLVKLQNSTQTFAIFGPSGSGKTALCMMIANECYPRNKFSNTLALLFDVSVLESIWQQKNLPGISSDPYIQHLVRMGHRELKGFTVDESHKKEYERNLESLQGYLDRSDTAVASNKRLALTLLVETANLAGFNRIICLVDQINEIPGIEDSFEKMGELIAPLMSSTYSEIKGLSFRFFLPIDFSEFMHQRQNVFRLTKLNIEYIYWDSRKLKALISERLRVASNKEWNALWQLCGKDLKIIDEYITDESICHLRPRAVIWLANRLIESHCEPEIVAENTASWEPGYDIDLKTWIKVRKDWDAWGRKQIIGESYLGTEEFSYRDGKCYFYEQLINLKREHTGILGTLILAQNITCSKEILIQSAWPNDPTRNAHHLQVEISRLKDSLTDQGIPADWIQSVYSSGYKLSKPSLERSGTPKRDSQKRKNKNVTKN